MARENSVSRTIRKSQRASRRMSPTRSALTRLGAGHLASRWAQSSFQRQRESLGFAKAVSDTRVERRMMAIDEESERLGIDAMRSEIAHPIHLLGGEFRAV